MGLKSFGSGSMQTESPRTACGRSEDFMAIQGQDIHM